MKKELLQELATELAEILRREKKELTRDQLFMRCRDGVSIENVIDAMTELCRIGSVRAHGGAYKFEFMPDFQNKPESEEAKPEAELLSPADEPVAETKAHNVLDTVGGREIKAPEWMRPVHHDSVDHDTIILGMVESMNKALPEPIQPHRLILNLADERNLSYRAGVAIEYICAGDYRAAIDALRELAEKQK